MTRLPYGTIDRKIPDVLAERMKQCATEVLDERRTALIEKQQRVQRTGWFS